MRRGGHDGGTGRGSGQQVDSGRGLEVDWNSRDRCRNYVPNLFDRHLHDLVLASAALNSFPAFWQRSGGGKSGKQIERCAISTFQVAESTDPANDRSAQPGFRVRSWGSFRVGKKSFASDGLASPGERIWKQPVSQDCHGCDPNVGRSSRDAFAAMKIVAAALAER